ncbi:hypothetical protein JCM10207_007097 [Rhodosporidiobolus poonsookiae]
MSDSPSPPPQGDVTMVSILHDIGRIPKTGLGVGEGQQRGAGKQEQQANNPQQPVRDSKAPRKTPSQQARPSASAPPARTSSSPSRRTTPSAPPKSKTPFGAKKSKRRPNLGPIALDPTPPSTFSFRPGSTYSSRAELQNGAAEAAYNHGFNLVVYNSPARYSNGLKNRPEWDGSYDLSCSLGKTVPAGTTACPFRVHVVFTWKSDGAEQAWSVNKVVNEHNHPPQQKSELRSPTKYKIMQTTPTLKKTRKERSSAMSQSPQLGEGLSTDEDSSSSSDDDEEDEIALAVLPSPKKPAQSLAKLPAATAHTTNAYDNLIADPWPSSLRAFDRLDALYATMKRLAADGSFSLSSVGALGEIKFRCTREGTKSRCPWTVVVELDQGSKLYRVDEDKSYWYHDHQLASGGGAEADGGGGFAAAPPESTRLLQCSRQPNPAQTTPLAAPAASALSQKRPRSSTIEKQSVTSSRAQKQSAEHGKKRSRKEEAAPPNGNKPVVENLGFIDLANSDDEEDDVKPNVALTPSPSPHTTPTPHGSRSTARGRPTGTLETFLDSLDPVRARKPGYEPRRLSPLFRALGLDVKYLTEVVQRCDVPVLVEQLVEELKKRPDAAPADAMELRMLGVRLAERARV